MIRVHSYEKPGSMYMHKPHFHSLLNLFDRHKQRRVEWRAGVWVWAFLCAKIKRNNLEIWSFWGEFKHLKITFRKHRWLNTVREDLRSLIVLLFAQVIRSTDGTTHRSFHTAYRRIQVD